MPVFPAARSNSTPATARFSTSRLVRGSLMLFAAVVLALFGTGGTYALLSASASVMPATSITAGTASLAVSNAQTDVTNLVPGETRAGSFLVTNTGNAPLTLSVDAITGATAANGLSVGVAASTNGTCSPSTAPVAGGSLGITLGASGSGAETTVLCLVVGMAANAPASAMGITSSLAISIGGVQP